MSDRNTFEWLQWQDAENANMWWSLARSLDPVVWEAFQFAYVYREGTWILIMFTHGGAHHLRISEEYLN